MSEDEDNGEPNAAALIIKFVLLCLAGFAIVASLIGTGLIMLMALAIA